MPNLERFTAAQDQPGSGFAAALAEIRAGSKRGHWVWYVFPQLSGLGSSAMSQAYAIRDRAEAVEYLQDPTLRSRLLLITSAIADALTAASPPSLVVLMGSAIDARKLVSSLTLFHEVARTLAAAPGGDKYIGFVATAAAVLSAAAAQGYPPCAHTLAHLRERA
jgi:uncharacterized protein (DUF1810 family)